MSTADLCSQSHASIRSPHITSAITEQEMMQEEWTVIITLCTDHTTFYFLLKTKNSLVETCSNSWLNFPLLFGVPSEGDSFVTFLESSIIFTTQFHNERFCGFWEVSNSHPHMSTVINNKTHVFFALCVCGSWPNYSFLLHRALNASS